jgi:hypothetical protein
MCYSHSSHRALRGRTGTLSGSNAGFLMSCPGGRLGRHSVKTPPKNCTNHKSNNIKIYKPKQSTTSLLVFNKERQLVMMQVKDQL